MQAKEPARKKWRWRFRPNNTALSVVITPSLVQVNMHPGSMTAYSSDKRRCVLLATWDRCCKWRQSGRWCRSERHTGPVRTDIQTEQWSSLCLRPFCSLLTCVCSIAKICMRTQRQRSGSKDTPQWILAREKKNGGIQVLGAWRLLWSFGHCFHRVWLHVFVQPLSLCRFLAAGFPLGRRKQ